MATIKSELERAISTILFNKTSLAQASKSVKNSCGSTAAHQLILLFHASKSANLIEFIFNCVLLETDFLNNNEIKEEFITSLSSFDSLSSLTDEDVGEKSIVIERFIHRKLFELSTILNHFVINRTDDFRSHSLSAGPSSPVKRPTISGRNPSFIGLHNQGNYCYLTSVIQQIYMQPGLRNTLIASCEEAEGHRALMFGELLALLSYAQCSSIDPTQFISSLQDWKGQYLSVDNQHDARDGFILLIKQLQFTLKLDPSNNQNLHLKNPLSNYFKFSLYQAMSHLSFKNEKQKIKENKEKHGKSKTNERNAQFWERTNSSHVLSVDCTLGCLENALESYFSPKAIYWNHFENQDEDNVDDIDKTYESSEEEQNDLPANTSRRVSLSKCGEGLVIHLKRFKVTQDQGERNVLKNDVCFSFPLELDLSHYATANGGGSGGGDSDHGEFAFSLTGVVTHQGSLSNGHYVSYAKSLSLNEEDEVIGENEEEEEEWYRFDDKMVVPWYRSEEDHGYEEESGLVTKLQSECYGGEAGASNAMLIFYKKTIKKMSDRCNHFPPSEVNFIESIHHRPSLVSPTNLLFKKTIMRHSLISFRFGDRNGTYLCFMERLLLKMPWKEIIHDTVAMLQQVGSSTTATLTSENVSLASYLCLLCYHPEKKIRILSMQRMFNSLYKSIKQFFHNIGNQGMMQLEEKHLFQVVLATTLSSGLLCSHHGLLENVLIATYEAGEETSSLIVGTICDALNRHAVKIEGRDDTEDSIEQIPPHREETSPLKLEEKELLSEEEMMQNLAIAEDETFIADTYKKTVTVTYKNADMSSKLLTSALSAIIEKSITRLIQLKELKSELRERTERLLEEASHWLRRLLAPGYDGSDGGYNSFPWLHSLFLRHEFQYKLNKQKLQQKKEDATLSPSAPVLSAHPISDISSSFDRMGVEEGVEVMIDHNVSIDQNPFAVYSAHPLLVDFFVDGGNHLLDLFLSLLTVSKDPHFGNASLRLFVMLSLFRYQRHFSNDQDVYDCAVTEVTPKRCDWINSDLVLRSLPALSTSPEKMRMLCPLLALLLLNDTTLSRQFIGITLNSFLVSDQTEHPQSSVASSSTPENICEACESAGKGNIHWSVSRDKSLYRGLVAFCSIQDSLQVMRVDLATAGLLRTLESMSKSNDRKRVCLGLRYLVKMGRSCGLVRQWLCQHESSVLWLLDLFNQWMDETNESPQLTTHHSTNDHDNVGLWGWLDLSIIRSQLIEMMNAKGQGGGFQGGQGQGIWSGYDSDDDPNLVVGHKIKLKQKKSPIASSSSSSTSSTTGRVLSFEGFTHSPGGLHCIISGQQRHLIDLTSFNWVLY